MMVSMHDSEVVMVSLLIAPNSSCYKYETCRAFNFYLLFGKRNTNHPIHLDHGCFYCFLLGREEMDGRLHKIFSMANV